MMAAILLEGERGRQWRALRVSDAKLSRRNYLYSLPPARATAAAVAVAAEPKDVARELVTSGARFEVQTMGH
jgi:LysR family tcuABC transcriptional regulator